MSDISNNNLHYVMILAVVISILSGLIGTFVIPSYEQVLSSLGDALPKTTKFVFEYNYLLWIYSVISFLVILSRSQGYLKGNLRNIGHMIIFINLLTVVLVFNSLFVNICNPEIV